MTNKKFELLIDHETFVITFKIKDSNNNIFKVNCLPETITLINDKKQLIEGSIVKSIQITRK